MTTEKKYPSEDERITALEGLFARFQARFASLEHRIAAGGIRSGLAVPMALYPIYASPFSIDDEPPAPGTSGSTCFDDVTIPIEGQSVYGAVPQNAECPAPPIIDQVKAVLDARNNLKEFGRDWCATGGGHCDAGICDPVLSGIRVVKFETRSGPVKDGTKPCIVIASIMGTISCRCQ